MKRPAFLAWSLFALSFVFAAATVWMAVLERGTPLPRRLGAASPAGEATFAAMVVAFAALGALIASRRPDNKIGWILSASPFFLALTSFSRGVYIYDFFTEPGSLDLPFVVYWVANWIWAPGFLPVLTFLLLIFPNGRLPSRRWRAGVALTALAIGLIVLGYGFRPGPLEDYRLVENEFGLQGTAGDVMGAFLDFGFPVFSVAAVVSVASLVYRFRRSSGEERQQLRWMAAAAVFVFVAWVVNNVLDQVFEVNSPFLLPLALLALPVAAAVAVLRYRLYDLDLVVNRTLVYAGLSATLTVAYLAIILVLQLVLDPVTSESDLSVAVSTLAVAALFRPARRRVQALVDRRFYRRRFDAARTLDRFGARLREELAIDSLSSELCSVVADAMQPAHVSLWLRHAPGGASGAARSST